MKYADAEQNDGKQRYQKGHPFAVLMACITKKGPADPESNQDQWPEQCRNGVIHAFILTIPIPQVYTSNLGFDSLALRQF